jgi:hypothetical protein
MQWFFKMLADANFSVLFLRRLGGVTRVMLVCKGRGGSNARSFWARQRAAQAGITAF